MDLAEKNYQNLIDVLANNAISSATASSSNATLSLPQSSTTFLNPSTPSDNFRRQEQDIYHNGKGDIAD